MLPPGHRAELLEGLLSQVRRLGALPGLPMPSQEVLRLSMPRSAWRRLLDSLDLDLGSVPAIGRHAKGKKNARS
jgi:hypothetical protein